MSEIRALGLAVDLIGEKRIKDDEESEEEIAEHPLL
jgi:hypothetical protein